MKTFPFCVRPSLTINSEPRVNKVQFGDGYQQRQRKGINNLLRSYPVVVKVKNEERFQVDRFFSDCAGVEAFLYNDPFLGKAVKVVCTKWTASMGRTHTEFNCEFEEVM
ncbi:phage tail protein [Pasteurellaceae bacterium 20609_3]|uniref:phage tail protein n=1 Tax=Spirabiliibacterium mucosae TaxID=28156 RepID=UPI001AACB791|nr:phage tail protein [Spirabiliibacterium mucosae]MBE2898079.1 phage tail protein [Spirabiliibacterium mucosae]